MKTWFPALATVVAVALSGPVRAEPMPLSEISIYLREMETAQGRFIQMNSDGSRSRGTLYIKRPGRARFEYDPPEQALVMAGGGQVAIFDNRSNSVTPEQYPLRRTPLNLILERNVNLAARNMVVGHYESGDNTVVVAQDPEAPQNGRIEIVFAENPIRLIEWTVIDGGGNRTRVVLGDLVTGEPIPASYFNIVLEQQRRQR